MKQSKQTGASETQRLGAGQEEKVEEGHDERQVAQLSATSPLATNSSQQKRAGNRAARIVARQHDAPANNRIESNETRAGDDVTNTLTDFDDDEDRPGAIHVAGPDANSSASISIMTPFGEHGDNGDAREAEQRQQFEAFNSLLPKAQALSSMIVEGFAAGTETIDHDNNNIEDYVAQRIADALEAERRNVIQAEEIDIVLPRTERHEQHQDARNFGENVEGNRNLRRAMRTTRIAYMILVGFVALLVAVAIVVAVVLSTSNDESPTNAEDAISEPTEFPSISPTPDQFRPLLQLMVSRGILDEKGSYDLASPQMRALQWLSRADSYPFLSELDPDADDALAQRYVLAVLYYSTTPESTVEDMGWKNDNSWWLPNDRTHWLSNSPTCQWYGLTCNGNGEVSQIQLGKCCFHYLYREAVSYLTFAGLGLT